MNSVLAVLVVAVFAYLGATLYRFERMSPTFRSFVASGFGFFLLNPADGGLLPVRGNRLPATTVARLVTAPDVIKALETHTVQVPSPPRCLEGSVETVVAAAPIPWPQGSNRPLGLICVTELYPQKKLLSLDDQRFLDVLAAQLGRSFKSGADLNPLDRTDTHERFCQICIDFIKYRIS